MKAVPLAVAAWLLGLFIVATSTSNPLGVLSANVIRLFVYLNR